MTDEVLMQKTAAGDGSAFDQLVVRYRPALVGFAKRFVVSEAVAEDVAQEALVRLWQVRDGYQVTGSASLTTYLYTITRRLTIDAHRRQTGEAPIHEPTSVEALVIAREQEDRLNMALENLPDSLRLPLLLQLRQELSYDQIATQLQLPVTTVKARLHRARARLRQAFPEIHLPERQRSKMNEKKLTDELAALRHDVEQLKVAIVTAPTEENPLETFLKQRSSSASGLTAGLLTSRTGSRGSDDMTWAVSHVVRDDLAELTDADLEKRAARLALLSELQSLKIFREFARCHYAGQPRILTAEALQEALGKDVTESLARLVEAEALRVVPEGYEWSGLGMSALVLLGCY
jgi:RNA polymerase sigma-70 factor, ECF subfamily